MTDLCADFEKQLATWRVRYADRPRRELQRLLLLAVQREQLAAVSYRDTLAMRHLDRMADVGPDACDLIQAAMIWAWRDEAEHARVLEALIDSIASPRVRLRCRGQRLAGSTGGWMAAVRMSESWSRAPVSRALAGVLERVGELAGQVPPEMRAVLRRASFRDFCRLEAQAERTSFLAYGRLRELLGMLLPGIAPAFLPVLEAIEADEGRHVTIFDSLAEALDDHDRLREGWDAARLRLLFRNAGIPEV